MIRLTFPVFLPCEQLVPSSILQRFQEIDSRVRGAKKNAIWSCAVDVRGEISIVEDFAFTDGTVKSVEFSTVFRNPVHTFKADNQFENNT